MNLDPTAPLIDLTVVDGKPVFTIEQPSLHCPCKGFGWLGREWLNKRAPECTCGGGDPEDYRTFHSLECDSVPCPFCPAETPDA